MTTFTTIFLSNKTKLDTVNAEGVKAIIIKDRETNNEISIHLRSDETEKDRMEPTEFLRQTINAMRQLIGDMAVKGILSQMAHFIEEEQQ